MSRIEELYQQREEISRKIRPHQEEIYKLQDEYRKINHEYLLELLKEEFPKCINTLINKDITFRNKEENKINPFITVRRFEGIPCKGKKWCNRETAKKILSGEYIRLSATMNPLTGHEFIRILNRTTYYSFGNGKIDIDENIQPTKLSIDAFLIKRELMQEYLNLCNLPNKIILE